jgi:RnfABCDGE-type electron transport complex B subunit
MDIIAILTAVISVSAIGAILAALLCVTSKLMHVKIDERQGQLMESLPGVNCGVCGYPGCSGFAVALISGEAKPNLCTPGGSDLLEKISAIMGVDTGSIEAKTAVVRCKGDINARQKKMEYKGIQTCEAAKAFFGGDNSCTFGCLGYGDCQIVCPTDAICMTDGLARIITQLCTGCNLCVKACPKKLISIEKANIPLFVACKNTEKGAVTRKKCSSGCIACTKCVKVCCECSKDNLQSGEGSPVTAITMENNLAVIDYEKCCDCGKCVDVCMTKCITPLLPRK